jgi:hypothetical protein
VLLPDFFEGGPIGIEHMNVSGSDTGTRLEAGSTARRGRVASRQIRLPVPGCAAYRLVGIRLSYLSPLSLSLLPLSPSLRSPVALAHFTPLLAPDSWFLAPRSPLLPYLSSSAVALTAHPLSSSLALTLSRVSPLSIPSCFAALAAPVYSGATPDSPSSMSYCRAHSPRRQSSPTSRSSSPSTPSSTKPRRPPRRRRRWPRSS